MLSTNALLWIAFTLFVVALLMLDLIVFHRHAHAVSIREAAVWSVVWIVLALIFCAGVYYWMGSEKALEFLAGYLIEKSLSVDNLFVFLLIFSYFSVPAEYQHRVLFWGILGAIVMRAVFILVGATLLEMFHWIVYIFGAFLVFTGLKLALQRHDEELKPEANPVLRLFRRFVPVTENYEGERFLVRRAGKLMATPLLAVLVLVESTDLVFAVDSIPAIFAVSKDPFIVYTSNILAILGLRALYFLLAGIMGLFRYLKLGLAVVLTFVGVKMLISPFYHIEIGVSLGFIAAVLGLSIIASVLIPAPGDQKQQTGDR